MRGRGGGSLVPGHERLLLGVLEDCEGSEGSEGSLVVWRCERGSWSAGGGRGLLPGLTPCGLAGLRISVSCGGRGAVNLLQKHDGAMCIGCVRDVLGGGEAPWPDVQLRGRHAGLGWVRG